MALSGASMVGVPVRIQPPAPGGEQIKVCVVFRECVAIQPFATHPETGAFLSVDKRKVEEWIQAKARILSFEGGNWLNLDDPKTRFIDSKLNRIEGVDACIKRLREIYLQHPEIERVRPFYRPLSEAEARRLDVESDARLAVPCDKEVERWALAGIGHKDGHRRAEGASALYYFRSDDNVKRLRRLLTDPYFYVESNGNKQYPVRNAARNILELWGLLEG